MNLKKMVLGFGVVLAIAAFIACDSSAPADDSSSSETGSNNESSSSSLVGGVSSSSMSGEVSSSDPCDDLTTGKVVVGSIDCSSSSQ